MKNKQWIVFFVWSGIMLQVCQNGGGHAKADPVDRHSSHLIYTHHARCRMDCSQITGTEVREVLVEGQIDYRKSEPDAEPDPKYPLEANTREGQHLRVIFAPAERGMVVITCNDPDAQWHFDC